MPAGLEIVDGARLQLVDHHPRHEDGGYDTAEVTAIVLGSHANDGVRQSSHPKGLPHDVGIASVSALPIAVAKHHDRVAAWRDVVLRQEEPAKLRLDP